MQGRYYELKFILEGPIQYWGHSLLNEDYKNFEIYI